MMATHRSNLLTAQDVVSGGGDFGCILQRAIRRPDPSVPPPPLPSDTIVDDDADDKDWSRHHISYSLLDSTLDFFAARRSGIQSRLTAHASLDVRCASSTLKMGLDEFHAVLNEYANIAPFRDDGVDGYRGARALGKSPPDPGRVDRPVESSPVSSAYQNMDHVASCAAQRLTEADIVLRLSHVERTELSALLDKQVEKAATFYRHRVSQLAPPREDGGTAVSFPSLCGAEKPSLGCADFDFMRCGDGDSNDGVAQRTIQRPSFAARYSSLESNDILLPSSSAPPPLSFTEMAGEILELHAFVTTNIVVVRQILIRYDAYARSVGGSPMSSWYQTTRRTRVKGRTSDYRDLLVHSKLVRLSRAYMQEFKRHEEEVRAGEVSHAVASGGEAYRKKRRLREFSKAFYRIIDSAEEMKNKQRLKWRQTAMDLEGEEYDDNHGHHEEQDKNANNDMSVPATSIDQRMTTPPPGGLTTSSDGLDDTPLQSDNSVVPKPPAFPDNNHPSNIDMGEDIAYQIHIFKCIQSKTQRSIEKTSTGHISGWWDNTIATVRDYFLMGSTSDNLSLMPQFLIMRGKSLKSSLLVVAQWREARRAYLEGSECLLNPKEENLPPQQPFDQWFGGFCGESRPDSSSSPTKSSFKAKLALFMNILACFFYMMNYYIVEPSSTRYANALGMGDAMSGLIIGAMPWAAIMSAIVYSIWSNHNYRYPLLTSGVLLMSGNLIYATAYRRQSITMALCGRFLTGLGGPRSMNRRYIADTTPLAYRTAVNAAFGTATAMGAALGPATAIMIDGVDVEFDLPLYGTVYFNGMTGPGFIMCTLWILFTVVLACTFEEPERSGLEEQRQKEMADIEALATCVSSSLEMSSLPSSGKHELSHDNEDGITGRPQQKSATPYLDESCNCASDGHELCTGSNPSIDKENNPKRETACSQLMFVLRNLTVPVRVCMFLLFSKMFTVESVISAASMVTKNRYDWQVRQVGTLGTIVGCLTIPISIFIGWVSQYREDRVLMIYLMSFATFGMALLVDVTDFVNTDTVYYNAGNPLAVGPQRYVAGYLLVFCSVQAFDGVVGSVLSKVIPTALATGTLNSGLLATVVGTVSASVI
ncbi:hypothetical protein HJC23_006449 [Cyclotella cryptica]|uniref:SPX domain-containing protein n=1 Tax=Cyclotella cryptica TaxID=29204 RepID=A0ABD3QV18_9STRA|eukprot:CCRYP_001857-RA/>CCRYP_001857-RA protein AED:0.00 eAED:0.00 QI:229/-1/1/1/-1/1/1/891/1100